MNGYLWAGIEIASGQPTPQARLVEPILLASDEVELIRDVPGRKILRAGIRGTVVAGDEADSEWGMVTLCFAALGNRPWLLRRQHLRHVAAPGTLMDAGDPHG